MALAGSLSTPACASASPEPDADAVRASTIRTRIAAFESSASSAPSGDIRKLTFHGRPAYLITSPCCDQFNYLYDANGKRLCAPSGGIAGAGDGRCPEVLKPSKP